MKLYRFSPIKDKSGLLEAIRHIHLECYKLCHQSFGASLANSGNMGIFCHYEEEYDRLVKIREELTEPSDNPKQKYYRLHNPIVIPATGNAPETSYYYLYIRKPDPYRHHVGDVDFFLEPEKYTELKEAMLNGAVVRGARVFDRPDLDMIELYDPDSDVLGYISTEKMTEKVRVKLT
jgi:hypothetical protein